MVSHLEREALLDQQLYEFNDLDLDDSASVVTSKPITSSLQKPWFHRFLITRSVLPGVFGVCMLLGALYFPDDADDRIEALTRIFGAPVPSNDLEDFLVVAPEILVRSFFVSISTLMAIVVGAFIATAIVARRGQTCLASRVLAIAPICLTLIFCSIACLECTTLGWVKSLSWWWLMAAAAFATHCTVCNEQLFMPMIFGLGWVCLMTGSYPLLLSYPEKISYINWFWWVMGIFNITVVTVVFLWAWVSACQFEKLIQADKQTYDDMWAVIIARDPHEIAAINQVVGDAQRDFSPNLFCRQQIQGLDGIYGQARAINHAFQEWVATVAEETGGYSSRLQPKKVLRAMQKTRRVYKNDAARLCDVVRSSIIYETPRDLREGLKRVLRDCDVRRIKHRFAPDYNSAESAGYRDLMVNVGWSCVDGKIHICELQLHLEEMYMLKKDGGHARYVKWRDGRGG